jgi:hypothetical protein
MKFKVGDKVMFDPQVIINDHLDSKYFGEVFTIKEIIGTDISLQEELKFKWYYKTRFMKAEKYMHNQEFQSKMEELLK